MKERGERLLDPEARKQSFLTREGGYTSELIVTVATFSRQNMRSSQQIFQLELKRNG